MFSKINESFLALSFLIIGFLLSEIALATEFYPLGPGMRWTYQVREGDGEPTTESLVVDEFLGDGTFHMQPSSGGEGIVVQVEGDKIFSIANVLGNSLQTLILDFSAEVGTSWEIPCDGKVTLESTSESVSIPAGDFDNCWLFRTEIRCLPFLTPVRTWYYPGLGRIKTEQDNAEGKFVEDLISFESLGSFSRGDANADGQTNLSDASTILNWFFRNQGSPFCMESADVNRNGLINLSDAVYLLNYLFRNSAPPPHPFPECAVSSLYFFPCEESESCREN